MTMKELTIPSYQVPEDNMSNLTSASGDQASIVSSLASPNPQPVKKKRNLPGNPDPEAEVISLSPTTLMAKNRFLCEICNKGFQREQNLQLHRRGHNLPWKLKQRSSSEAARKKVYVCPEASCVHHDAARALGDLTGIKKHFSRKHGEKKWKCEKCSKKYAVQSDWKAHSKICGTREYRCDCGTLFSRRDSFITHRAFCDALAEESKRAITAHPLLFSQPISMSAAASSSQQQLDHPLSFAAAPMAQFPHHMLGSEEDQLSLKRENQQQEFGMRPDVPPWLACDQQQQQQHPSSIYSTARLEQQYYSQENDQNHCAAAPYQAAAAAAPAASAHMSATALLQKAAQIGATMSKPPRHGQMANTLHSTTNSSSASAFASLGLSSHQELGGGGGGGGSNSTLLPHDMMLSSLSSASGFVGSSFGEAFGGMLKRGGGGGGGKEEGGGAGSDGMTRDFLGLQRPFSQSDILMNMAGMDHRMNSSSSSYEQTPQQHNNKQQWS
ncbi:protein indeterminate-domain 11-like [Iris pallida]|uniref:Protein EARLY HEADING DATE 2 n=1 Tax=Iris pallida TaxID=29817 RepID=A0AAX6EE61_IRIPA|nr:protein indeterminate-domain 11-like [Iris pallida]